MPDYKNGKIYKLWSPEGDEIYIGSTIQPLYKRFHHHKIASVCRSKILFQKYNDVRVELLECCPCDNKEQLNKKEGEYIRKLDCVNKKIPLRTRREYNADNKDKIKEQTKEYREKNKEYYIEYSKEYRENNKDKINEKKKEYYENNKEKINEWRMQRITCECGRTTIFCNKARHERSKFHQDAIGGASTGLILTSTTA
jgi:hypothetical protein